MSSGSSFYRATDRQRITQESRDAVREQYSHNYTTLLPRERDAHILDLGCSEGIALEWLMDNGYNNVVGVDSDQVAIAQARERLGGKLSSGQVVCADIKEYLENQEDNSVDRIFMFNVIEHLEKPILLNVLAEVRRSLRPDGTFVAQTGNIENPFNLGLFARDFTHQIPFASNSLRQALLMSRFEAGAVEVRPVRYRTTVRNWPLRVAEHLAGWALKKAALTMRIEIRETSALIYCVARK